MLSRPGPARGRPRLCGLRSYLVDVTNPGSSDIFAFNDDSSVGTTLDSMLQATVPGSGTRTLYLLVDHFAINGSGATKTYQLTVDSP